MDYNTNLKIVQQQIIAKFVDDTTDKNIIKETSLRRISV